MNISITELETLFSKIIDKLKKEINEEPIEIKTDFYRLISTDNWDDFSNKEIITGSLKDDVQELKNIVNNKKRILTYVDFDRVASLLREISQNQNPI